MGLVFANDLQIRENRSRNGWGFAASAPTAVGVVAKGAASSNALQQAPRQLLVRCRVCVKNFYDARNVT